MGDATLVPPRTIHPDSPYVSYTATPLDGAASAETSFISRQGQAWLVCHDGFLRERTQPLPVPCQALSV